jgi:hypothetical protein
MRRPRFRVRTIMIAVAILGVGLRAGPVLLRAPRHWRLSPDMVQRHTERQATILKCIDRLKAGQSGVHPPNPRWPSPWGMIERCRMQLDYHARMQRHWERVAYQPWRSIRAELSYDVAEQDPSFIWHTVEYCFPPELGPADY